MIFPNLHVIIEAVSSTLLLAAAVWILLMLSLPAYAYLDPGSGSMVLQVLLGGIAAVAVVVKLFWHRILEILGIKKSGTKTEAGPDSSSGPEE